MKRNERAEVTCQQVQQWSNLYINDALDDEYLPAYLEHIEQCSECRDDLMLNYSILTAIRQLSDGEDFSESYVKEMEARLIASRDRLLHAKRHTRTLRTVALLLFVVAGIVIGFSAKKDPIKPYLPQGEKSDLRIEHYGFPSGYDPVYNTILEYNDRVIAKLREGRR